MVPGATLLGAQHYKACTGFSSPKQYRTTNFATLTKIKKSPKKSDNNQCLYHKRTYGRLSVMLNTLSSLNIEIIIIIIIMIIIRTVCFVCPVVSVLEGVDVDVCVKSFTSDTFRLGVLNRFSLEKELRSWWRPESNS